MLHILDLTIFCDLFASAYIVWTDDRAIFDAPSRDGRIQKIMGSTAHGAPPTAASHA